MFVLGIDPGLTRTGYGLVRSGHPPLATSVGVIRTPVTAPTAERLAELYRDLTQLVSEMKPDVVAIERVFTNRNLNTAADVGRASGVCLLVAAQAGVVVREHSPTAVKLAIAGDGKADKRMVQDMVRRRLRLEQVPRPADAADALAIALCELQTSIGLRP